MNYQKRKNMIQCDIFLLVSVQRINICFLIISARHFFQQVGHSIRSFMIDARYEKVFDVNIPFMREQRTVLIRRGIKENVRTQRFSSNVSG
jgi:hypothetical protein